MSLQIKMVEKIDSFGGIKKLSNELAKCAMRAPKDKQFFVDNMIIYFRMLYTDLPEGQVEQDAKTYEAISLKTITFLKSEKSLNCCPVALFLIELINFKLDYVNNRLHLKRVG